MSVIFDQYEERLQRLKRNPSTIHGFQKAVRPFEGYLRANRVDPEKADPVLIEEYFAQLDRAPSTKKLHLTHIGAAYRYAHRRGLVPRDPTVDVLLERIPDKEPNIIPNDELRAMKERLSTDREWMIWHLLVYTGMRRSEILNLMWDDVKSEDGTITIIGKGGKLRHIPIHPALGEAFAERTREPGTWVLKGQRRHGQPRPTADSTFQGIMSCMTRGEYSAHDFRRTVASSLYKNGVDGDTIDKIMGWSPRVVRTKYYVNVAPVQLQKAILKLYSDDPLS